MSWCLGMVGRLWVLAVAVAIGGVAIEAYMSQPPVDAAMGIHMGDYQCGLVLRSLESAGPAMRTAYEARLLVALRRRLGRPNQEPMRP